VHFAEEIASGWKSWRDRQIAQVLDELQDDDTLIVADLSRLGRSILECIEILALATRKGIRVYSVKGQLATGSHHPEQDHCPGVFDSGRDRARSDFAADHRGSALQKRTWIHPGLAKRFGQEQAGCF